MKPTVKTRVGALVALTCGLMLMTVLRAEDKPKPAPEKPAEKTETVKLDPIQPKPISDNVKKALEYLVKQQHANGGWGQGGGWRTNVDPKAGGGRVEGSEVKDPPDVGNTAIATLALIRAGNTPKEGQYKKEVTLAID